MPRKIERKFQEEYGKRKGKLIYYKWRNKHKKIEDHVKKHMLKY